MPDEFKLMMLENGAEPHQLAGTPEHGIVLAKWGEEWVTWAYYKVGDAIHCEHGHYFKENEWDKACINFRMRVERLFGWN